LVLEARQRIRDLGSIEGLVAVMRTGTSILHPVVTREFVDAHVGADPILAQQMAEIGVASSLTVPIAARGEVLGAILLTRVDPARAFDERDVAMAEELGRMVGLTVDNARLYQEAREADRQKDEFLAMLSHELRNPLAPIVSALEVMNFHRETNFADEREIIARNVRHIVRLVDDLLDVSRITQGKIQLEPERCEVASIIEAAVEMAKPLVTQRTQRLSVSLAGHRLPVNADQARLTQAIANLLNNASQYTEHGGAITISAHAHGNDAVIRVEDSGVGIAAELLPRIFDVFVQGSTALDRSQGGLGIGLTVVKHLVNLHGGSVSAHSAGLGKGSEFVVRLPLMDRRTV
jgi:signal transduction histidine kinase